MTTNEAKTTETTTPMAPSTTTPSTTTQSTSTNKPITEQFPLSLQVNPNAKPMVLLPRVIALPQPHWSYDSTPARDALLKNGATIIDEMKVQQSVLSIFLLPPNAPIPQAGPFPIYSCENERGDTAILTDRVVVRTQENTPRDQALELFDSLNLEIHSQRSPLFPFTLRAKSRNVMDACQAIQALDGHPLARVVAPDMIISISLASVVSKSNP